MRVLVAPDSFGGTLTAVEAAAAIAEGWTRRSPHDEITLTPMSDGGPGFVDVLHASLGGELLSVTVIDHYGDDAPAAILMVEDTAYLEGAQACGLHLTARREPERATSYGLGQLVSAAVAEGARRVIVGLGGTATLDGGAGMLAALGARAHPDEALLGGPHSLELLDRVDLTEMRERLDGVEIVFASDIDNPLLGLRGAANVFGAHKGLADGRAVYVDEQLTRLADCTDRRLADAKGAGAGGGLGFGFLLASGERADGVGLVASAVGLPDLAREVDLVVTGEGSFDFQSRSGKVPYGVARVSTEALRPCIVLAGQVLVGSREMRALGVESAYAVVDLVGEEAAFGEPAQSLSLLAERVARTWSR